MNRVETYSPRRAVERRRGWGAGSMLVRTQGPDGRCERDIFRRDLAIGVCFQSPGSAVSWRLEGEPALDKTWPQAGGTHDMIVLPPEHKFECRCQGAGEGLWLFVEPDSLVDDARVKTFASRPRVDASWARDRLAFALACELRKESANGFPRGPMFLESAAGAFLAQLAYACLREERAEPRQRLSGPRLRLALDYIEAHLDRNVTLGELAALTRLTPRYFCSAFREATGRPPHQFQIERRVERAKQLLIEGDLPLIEIAYCVGFASQSHLNAYFRRFVGTTPAHFRAEGGAKAPCERRARA